MSLTDTLINFGGSLKALDDAGKVGGYLVLFGDPDHTDASEKRDYFTADTDFGPATKSLTFYDHGLDETLGVKKLGTSTLKVDDSGVWLEAQLDKRDAYESKILAMAKAGKLGLSSGTAAHLVRREKQPNGAHKILFWPLGVDASFTPEPAEPRTKLQAIKSLAEYKGQHLGPDAERNATSAALERLQYTTMYAVGDHLRDDKKSLDEKLAACKGCYDEHRDIALKVIRAMMAGDDVDSANEIKHLLSVANAGLHAGLRLDDHSESVRAAVKGLHDRLADLAAKRAEAGRSLSAERRAELKALAGEVAALVLLAEPKPTADDCRRLEAELLAFDAKFSALA